MSENPHGLAKVLSNDECGSRGCLLLPRFSLSGLMVVDGNTKADGGRRVKAVVVVVHNMDIAATARKPAMTLLTTLQGQDLLPIMAMRDGQSQTLGIRFVAQCFDSASNQYLNCLRPAVIHRLGKTHEMSH